MNWKILNPFRWFRETAVTGPRENTLSDLSRRTLLKSIIAGAIVAPLVKLNPWARGTENRRLLRPPFSRVNDDEFMDVCIRCGMCMQVCKTNTLQPAYLIAGFEGLMTPVLCPDIAGCDPGCNACGDVCPTNAILPFTLEEKNTMKQGTAKLELDRCIGWTENVECNACVKICPTQAIKVVKLDGVNKPISIAPAECTGCAMCEEECNKIIANDSACVTSNTGRGLPTDMRAILKTLGEKEKAGASFLPMAAA